jgi:predicted transcriptional regulator of viral defense system
MAKIAEKKQSAQGKGGVLTLAQLRATGMSAMNASRAVKRGELLRIAHGVYQVPEQAEFLDDEMYSTQLRYNQIIYSHDSALYLHGLNDRDPLRYSVTVPTG